MRRKESRIVLAVILGLLLFWGGLSVTAEAANGEVLFEGQMSYV